MENHGIRIGKRLSDRVLSTKRNKTQIGIIAKDIAAPDHTHLNELCNRVISWVVGCITKIGCKMFVLPVEGRYISDERAVGE